MEGSVPYGPKQSGIAELISGNGCLHRLGRIRWRLAAFAILDRDRQTSKPEVSSVVCLETDVADMRSCKPRNRIASGSSDASESQFPAAVVAAQ